jgi:hypothetical protein
MKARENPFRSERVDALVYRAEGFSWETLETALAKYDGRGAIVGPKGHGKTTLLTQWAGRRALVGDQVVFLKMDEAQRRLTEAQRRKTGEGGWVFVDSAEQLSWLGWRELRRLTRPAEALVISTHQSGRLPTVFTCRTCPELLAELVEELDGVRPNYAELWQRHRGNVRLALRELYDECAAER